MIQFPEQFDPKMFHAVMENLHLFPRVLLEPVNPRRLTQQIILAALDRGETIAVYCAGGVQMWSPR